ncbi:MAG: DUF452 family protein [Candidatus Gastranaerophilales bacterium]|nr:DUF452 family protein [Candidatus Gastranaerophilales bacterium]
MKQYYINNNSDEIILFFNGWGSDERPYKHLQSSKDILIVYDYISLAFDFDFSKYKKVHLLTYSCGALIANIIQKILPPFKTKTVINGTAKPYNLDYGLSKEAYETFFRLTKKNTMDFRKKFLFTNEAELKLFNKSQPHRDIENCYNELIKLKDYCKIDVPQIKYDKIILSECDKVLPIENQEKYWGKKYKLLKDSNHVPFYNFKSFDEIIDF